jgi:hypothetical protein
MILIAHRGLIDGPDKAKENNPEWIEQVIQMGYSAEIDLWVYGNELYLGHDEPQYKIDIEWLRKYNDKLWIHVKDPIALDWMVRTGTSLHYFWHQEDDYTLTSRGYIWAYPGKQLTQFSISVCPEWVLSERYELKLYRPNCVGICSKYVGLMQK